MLGVSCCGCQCWRMPPHWNCLTASNWLPLVSYPNTPPLLYPPFASSAPETIECRDRTKHENEHLNNKQEEDDDREKKGKNKEQKGTSTTTPVCGYIILSLVNVGILTQTRKRRIILLTFLHRKK